MTYKYFIYKLYNIYLTVLFCLIIELVHAPCKETISH